VAVFEVLGGVTELPREEWNALVGEHGSPFLEWDWLASLEHAQVVGGRTGWHARPLVAREGGRLVAACPLYVKLHSEGEFVFDWGWAEAAQGAGIPYYPKLLVGVPFTPVSGSRVLIAPGLDRKQWTRELAGALRQLCADQDFSGAHVCFCTPEELAELQEAGYAARIGVQYHWRNRGYRDFADYLQRFRSKRRTQILRERRALHEQGVQIEVLSGDALPPELFPDLYAFYRSTVEVKSYGRPYLNERFFELVRDRFRERLCAVVARQDGRPIAATFNVYKGKVFYGRYWGARCELPFLHFNVSYYAAVEHCIASGFERFEPGAGGAFKLSRGFDAAPTYSAHYLREPRLARAVQSFLAAEREQALAAIAQLQEQSALKP
jgi:predicted N-acyltransferase